MLLSKNVEISVFSLDNNGRFECIGEINQFTALQWPDKYNGYGQFELWAPITEENKTLIKEGNILWCGGDTAAMIEIINSSHDDNGQKTYDIKGRTLEMLLTTRIIWGTYTCNNKYASYAMYEIVKKECINPSNTDRIIPFLKCAQDENLGARITYQKTGGEVYDALIGIADENELGFDVIFRPKTKEIIFKVTQGKDRTDLQSINKPVIFSTELEDILKSSYYKNTQSKKSVALVAGEESGATRKKVISGDNSTKGFLRRELYVDARDLQSEVQNDDGTTTTLPDAEYEAMLKNRGDEKLSDCEETETFTATMRTIGNVQYEYGRDFTKGDKVVVEDDELGVRVVATIDEAEENFDDEYELSLTLGYGYPTLLQQIKRKIQ